MKIAHKFHTEKSRVVELDGTNYHFKPADPANPHSPHVAEVTNEAHIQRFLSIVEGYCIYTTPDATPAATASRPTAQTQTAPPPESNGISPVDGGGIPAALDTELEEAGKQLNALNWQKLNAELAKGGIDEAVVTRALAIELAKPEADQRDTTIKIIKKYLGKE